MKTKLLLLTLFISAVTFAQYTAIPDTNFENALSAYDDIPNDGQVPTANISGITSLDVNNDPAEGGSFLFEITDLTGIQDFTALQTLNCSYNQLTILDLSQNTALQTLDCSFNQLTALNVSQNTALQYLDCIGNQLTALDVSQNTALQELYCVDNQLTALDVSQNTNLLTLVCGGNNLISLDVSQNTVLQMLWCSYTPLLTALDVSQNTDLQNLYCYNSQLTALNVKNGNNTNFTYFDATNNPNLTCIEVDDPAYSTANWTNIDPQTSFSLNCNNAETFVPDDNFENYLETHDANGNTVAVGDPNSMGNGIANDDYVTTANINTVTNLDISSQSVSDLTGIEDFTALQVLSCDDNQLTALNVSQNTALQQLNCVYNQLTTLDVSGATALQQLNCQVNQLTTLDVSQNTALQVLLCTNNQLTALDVSQNTALQELYCTNNQLTALDVNQNTNLYYLDCSGNQLTALDVSQNTALQELYCNDNQLTALDVNQNTALQWLYCNDNQITALDVSQNTALQVLNCYNNQLIALDVLGATVLQVLRCHFNQLTALDVSQNTALQGLSCTGNQLTVLDVSQNINLIELVCYDNQLTALDVSQNTALQGLSCTGNQLTALNVKNGNNTNFTYFDATNNPNLTCIEVDDPAYSTANWTNIDPQTSFSLNCNNAETYVPDDNFENYLETHDANGNTVAVGDPNSMGNGIANDDYVTTANINTVTNLDISSQSVSDLTGLQDFVSLEIFTATFNPIGTIDLSSNTVLTDFNCFDCQLTSVDVSQNANLERLYVDNNQLTALDVTNNSLLIELYVTNNQLTNIDVSQNPNLTFFNCNNNQITSLDISSNTALMSLNCQNNQLTSLDMRNGNNTAMTAFNATNNPDLTCIFVDDAAYSTANWTNIDPASTFVETQAECTALAVADFSFENNLSIYPNPAQNQVNIQIDRNSVYSIYNINGRLLKQGKLLQGINTLNIKNIRRGIYFIRITDKQMELTKKLIIK